MVTIVDYKSFERENGEKFFGLVVQGGIEAVKSQQTGKTYFTARTVTVPTTFDESTCSGLIGTKIGGVIKKVETDPYDYTVTETGEVIQLTHSYEYMTEEDSVITKNIVQPELVM
ncbi:MAG: hypothetical protein JNJ52_09975 [Flavobacterium sp.]|nr:hypothetical protein [Flavobacterium sp.]